MLSTNFVQETASTTPPAGWLTGQWNGSNTPHYSFDEHGANIQYSWKQNTLYHAVELSSDKTYTITFSLYNAGETGNMFYLSSDDYSILIGQSYNSNKEVGVGTTDSAIDGMISFQTKAGMKNPDTILTTSTAGFGYSNTQMDYTLTLTGGALTVAVTDGTHSWNSGELAVANTFSFDKVGFINDGGISNSVGNARVLNMAITTTVPEPATATLSLLALAGLASRRRRH